MVIRVYKVIGKSLKSIVMSILVFVSIKVLRWNSAVPLILPRSVNKLWILIRGKIVGGIRQPTADL